MPDDKVTFKANGDYGFGAPLQEMDVKQDTSGTGAPTEGGSNEGTATTAAPKAAGGAPQKFNMSRLRKNAASRKPKAEDKKAAEGEPAPEAAPAPAPVPKPARTRKPRPKPEPAPEPEKVPDSEVIPEPKEAPAPDPAPVDNPPTPDADSERESKEFKLSQLGLSTGSETERVVENPPAPAPEPAPARVSLSSLGHKNKPEAEPKKEVLPEPEPVPEAAPQVESAPAPEPEPRPEDPKVDAPPADVKKLDLNGTSATPDKPAEVKAPETVETAPEFVFHTLDDFLQVTGLELSDVSKFAKAVARAAMRGNAIWQSKAHEMLRAYSCLVPQGRGVPRGARYLMTIGWDVHVTSCYMDQNYSITDGSSNLTCTGICASVYGTPVALSTERKRSAIVL